MKLKLIKEPSTNTAFKREYYVNKKGQKYGEFKRWHINGQLHIHCNYKNNKLHGEYKEWWRSGQLHIHCYFKNDKLYGEFKNWWGINGQLNEKCYFKNGKYYSWQQYKRMKIKKILRKNKGFFKKIFSRFDLV